MTWASDDAHTCRERLAHSLSCVLFVVSESVEFSSGIDLANISSGCEGDWYRLSRVASDLSLTVSVAVQNKAAYYMYTIGIEKWKTISCSSNAFSFGIMKATEGTSYAGTICAYRNLPDLP